MQGVRPHLVGRGRLVQARQEAPGFEGVSGRLHRVEEWEAGGGIDWDALPASVVAWVRVLGTTDDYPILRGQPESPDFYLTHDAGDERSPHRRRMREGHRKSARHRLRASHVQRHHVRATRAVLFARLRRGSPHHLSLRPREDDRARVLRGGRGGRELKGQADRFRRRGGARRLPRGQIVPVRGRPGTAGGRCAGLGVRDVQLPGEQLAHRRLREGGGSWDSRPSE